MADRSPCSPRRRTRQACAGTFPGALRIRGRGRLCSDCSSPRTAGGSPGAPGRTCGAPARPDLQGGLLWKGPVRKAWQPLFMFRACTFHRLSAPSSDEERHPGRRVFRPHRGWRWGVWVVQLMSSVNFTAAASPVVLCGLLVLFTGVFAWEGAGRSSEATKYMMERIGGGSSNYTCHYFKGLDSVFVFAPHVGATLSSPFLMGYCEGGPSVCPWQARLQFPSGWTGH